MTQALPSAVASAAKLPDEEQNLLEQMASEAIQDFQAGRVQPIDELPSDLLVPPVLAQA